MSEKLPISPEKHEHLEAQPQAELETRKEQPRPEQQSKTIETLKHQAEHEAKSRKEIKVDKTEHGKPAREYLVTKELKAEALHRSLQRTRKHLKRSDRTLSRVIHQPVIDGLSKIGERTIARPRGILTGSIVALIGSSYLLYTAKHYGFVYNYWVIFVLFVGGYIIGLFIDIVVFGIKRTRHSK